MRAHVLPLPPAHLLVALSGGADSVALLIALEKLGYSVQAAHCNFHLRGEESLRDERFVKELCQERRIPLHIEHFDTRLMAKAKGISIEMAARELRYEWFARLLEQTSCQAVAVAHHQEDNVETFLLNLTRGAGIHGLTGMKPQNGRVIRPLLGVSREEIERFLQEERQNFITDSTNTDTVYKRNFVRHRLLPEWEQLNPAISNTLSETIERLAEAETFYKYAVRHLTPRCVTYLRDGAKIHIETLHQLPAPATLLYEWLQPYDFSSAQCKEIFENLHRPTGTLFESRNYTAVIHRGHLEVRQHPITIESLTLPSEGKATLPDGTSLHLEVVSRESLAEIPRLPAIACLDYDCLSDRLYCRSAATGDRFVPFCMKGSRLVSDYLTDRHRSVIDKKSAKVVCCGKDIVWLVGERPDHRYCLTENTKKVLLIRYEQHGL